MAPFRWVKACIESHGRPLYVCAFNPYTPSEHSLHLAAAGINQISIYEIGEDNEIRPKITFKDPSLSTFEDYSGEGSRASGARTNRIYALNWLYDERTQQVMVAFGGENAVIRVVDASNGKEVLDMTVRIWSSRTPVALAVIAGFEGHRDQILSCDWSPCGTYLASGSMDHTVRLWKITDEVQSHIDTTSSHDYVYKAGNLQLHDLEETCYVSDQIAFIGDFHTNYFDCVRFFDQFLLTKSSENVLMISKFGDFTDGIAGGFEGNNDTMKETSITQLAQLHIPHGDTWFLKFDVDPRKEWLLCGVRTGEIHAWHLSPDRLPSSEPDCTIDCSYVVQARTIRQVVFDPHGRLIACVSDDATITILIKMTAAANDFYYSSKYEDDEYEYRHVHAPKDVAKLIPKNRLMSESEWRSLGIQQSPGWVHYMIHPPERHVLLFRRPLPTKPAMTTGGATAVGKIGVR